MSHCWSGRVSVVCRSCPSGVPVVSRGVPVVLQCVSGVPVVSGGWCPSRVPVVSQWRLVVLQWCPVVSRWLVSQWCLEGVPVLFQWCPGHVPCFLGPGDVPPSGVPVVSGVPRGGVPVPTTISENLRLRGGWCSAGEVVAGVAVVWCRSVIRSVF